jgi:spore coat assembly protein SafA
MLLSRKTPGLRGGTRMSDQSMENNVGFQPGSISPNCPNGQFYTVKSGDTMFFIAKRNDISLQELINANPQIADPNTIYPGQVICIPLAPPVGVCPSNQIYRVVSGDTMYEIARRFGITLDTLIEANPQISDPNLIFPGQEICLPLPSVAPPAPAPIPVPGPYCNGMFYTVKAGDTLFEIARANNVLLAALIAANPQIPDPNLIFPGQIICIPAPNLDVPLVPQPAICPITVPPQVPIQQPMPMPVRRPVLPIEQPMPCPAMPMPTPMPARRPVLPIEQPMPCPAMPMPMPMPARRPVAPIEQPMPSPLPSPFMPCPAGQGMMVPMPVYVVIPWDECPHNKRKIRHERRKKRCR